MVLTQPGCLGLHGSPSLVLLSSLSFAKSLRTLLCGTVEAFRFIEFFAGDANVTWCLKHSGFAGLKFDQSYGGRYNDIFEPAGFACLF